MKSLFVFFALLTSLSASALVEIPLMTVDHAVLYRVEKTRLLYSKYSGGILELITKAELRGHPEMSVQTFLLSKDLISLEDGEFIVRSEGVEAVCATLESNKVYETGDCEFLVVVKDNKIHTSLAIHE